MLDWSLADMARALRDGDASSVELTRFFLERIDRHNARINGFIRVEADAALAAAERADKNRNNSNINKLSGIPYAHKDIFCTRGVATTCASEMLRDFVPPYDATVSARLNDAGMVMLGKTNMDEFAMGSSTETGCFGPTVNPWREGVVAGGSSGGSAAAVAAGLAPCATATDTGGSIRQPAAFCGLTGVKPTYGRVSRYGMIAFASSLDQGGVIARSAEDCALLLRAIAGYDDKDPTSVNLDVPDYAAEIQSPDLRKKRVGLIKGLTERLDARAAEPLERAAEFYADAGCEIKTLEMPSLEWSIPAYYVIATAECSSNLSRYDGVRYGRRCDAPKSLEDLYARSRGEGFGPETKRRILVGTHVLSAGYYDAYYQKAQRVRGRISRDFAAAFAEADVLLTPTTPTTPFRLGEKINDPVEMYLSDFFTVPVNLAGLPAVSVPAGLDDGLPRAFQLIGGHFEESQLLAFAHAWQLDTDWHARKPGGFQ